MVAFPLASNAVGTITPVAEIVELAHAAGALAWADAVHYAPHGDIEIAELGCDVLLCSPYKFFGPHLGLAWVRRELSESWRPYKVRPQSDAPGQRHETGTLPHELLCGFVACVEYLHGVGWTFIQAHERALGQRFLDGLPDGWQLHGPPTMAGRVPTFCVSPPDETPAEAAARLGGGRLRRLGRQLLRRRGLQAPRAARRRRPHRHRPHEHGGRGRPAARGAAAGLTGSGGGRQGLLGDAARAQARREAGHRGRRPLHDEQRGARGPAARAEGDARPGRRPLGRLAEEGLASSRPTSTSPPCSRPASPPASSTTRAARSTPTGRRSASSTGSPTAEPGRRSGARDDRPGERGQDERRRRQRARGRPRAARPGGRRRDRWRSRRRGRPRACRAATTPRSSRARR